MFYPNVQQLITSWLPTLDLLHIQRNTSKQPTVQTQQIQLQPSESYYLNAGEYTVKVLSGRIWIPEVGVFDAGTQVRLASEQNAFTIHATQSRPIVFDLCCG